MVKRYNEYINESSNLLETTIVNPNLSIVLPGGCNGKCDFCFWQKSKPCKGYLEKVNNILYSLPNQFSKLSITGGEPTMSPYLDKVLEMVDRKVYNHTVLTSNGYKLLDFVPQLKGKIDHINISRHHYNEDINNSIFNSKMITNEELKKVTNRLNKVGIDVTFSAVLNEHLNTQKDIEKYIKFAKESGATKVFFRKPHGTLEPTKVERLYENYESNEYHCPVCRTKNQIIEGINISWKASLEEPSKELGQIYELIINENGELTKDWEGKLKVDYRKINEKVEKLYEDCGGGGGCGDSDSSSSKKEKKIKKKFRIGDKLKCIDTTKGGLSEDCVEFLKTYNSYKVLDVKSNLNIDIGYLSKKSKKFYFSPNRFEKIKKINPFDPYDEEDWGDEDDRPLLKTIIHKVEHPMGTRHPKQQISLIRKKTNGSGSFDTGPVQWVEKE